MFSLLNIGSGVLYRKNYFGDRMSNKRCALEYVNISKLKSLVDIYVLKIW